MYLRLVQNVQKFNFTEWEVQEFNFLAVSSSESPTAAVLIHLVYSKLESLK